MVVIPGKGQSQASPLLSTMTRIDPHRTAPLRRNATVRTGLSYTARLRSASALAGPRLTARLRSATTTT